MVTSRHVRRFPAAAWLALIGVALLALASRSLMAQDPYPEVVVYKTPTCGCCGLWVEHLRANGFTVRTHDVPSTTDARRSGKVPERLGSCHTAKVAGYAIEGHVPAREIARLLRERPPVAGLAVPGMPIGSPGMEQGSRRDAYDVVAFDASGRVSVYARYAESTTRNQK